MYVAHLQYLRVFALTKYCFLLILQAIKNLLGLNVPNKTIGLHYKCF